MYNMIFLNNLILQITSWLKWNGEYFYDFESSKLITKNLLVVVSYTNCASRISWQFFLSHHSTACLQKNSLTHQRKTPAKTNVCCYSQSIQKLLCDAIAAAKSKELARPKSIPQWHQRLLWLIFSTCLFFFFVGPEWTQSDQSSSGQMKWMRWFGSRANSCVSGLSLLWKFTSY